MLERNQWLAIGLISGFAYILGKDRESFGADDVDWMKRFVNNKLTQDDIRQANAWSWVAGKNNKHIEKDWLASGDLVGDEDTGTVNGMNFVEYLVMRHRNFTRDWEKGIKPTRNGIEYGSSLFSAEDKTQFEMLGSVSIDGVGIVTEGSPYLKNYTGEWDNYDIYDDDAAELIMSIPMNDSRLPLKDGEIELIKAMVYGYEHPRINDSWGELNEDGMFWTTKVMETLANYDPSEAESFEAEDSRRQLKKLMEGKSDAEKKRISKMVQVRGLENTIAELMTNAEVFAATTFDEDDDSPKINQEDWMPRTDCEICARPFTINRFGQQLIQHYLKESDNGEKAWKSKKNTDGTRRTARNLAGFFLYEYGLDALNQYVLFQDKTGISDKVIELLRLSLVERVIAGDVVNLIEMMDMSDEVDGEPMFGKKFEEDFGSEEN